MKITEIKNYKKFVKVENELEFNSGEINFIIGSNGSGKSTLLEIINLLKKKIINDKTISLKNRVKIAEDSLVTFEYFLDDIDKVSVKNLLSDLNISYDDDPYKIILKITNRISSFELPLLDFVMESFPEEYDQYKNMSQSNLNTAIKDISSEVIKDKLNKYLKLKSILMNFGDFEIIDFNDNDIIDPDEIFMFNYDSETLNTNDFARIFNYILKGSEYSLEEFKDLFTSSEDMTDEMKDQRDNLFESLSNHANRMIENDFSDLDINLIPFVKFEQNYLKISIKNISNNVIYSHKLAENSSGYKKLFKLLFFLKSYEGRNHRTILLIDEIEKELHINLRNQIVNKIRELVKNNNNLFVIATTHDPFIILNNDFDKIIAVETNDDGSSNIVTINKENDFKKLTRNNNNYDLVLQALQVGSYEKIIYYSSIDDATIAKANEIKELSKLFNADLTKFKILKYSPSRIKSIGSLGIKSFVNIMDCINYLKTNDQVIWKSNDKIKRL